MKRLLVLLGCLLSGSAMAQGYFAYAAGFCGWSDCFYLSLNQYSQPTTGPDADWLYLEPYGSQVFAYSNQWHFNSNYWILNPLGNNTYSVTTETNPGQFTIGPNMPYMGTNCSFTTNNYQWANTEILDYNVETACGLETYFNITGGGSWLITRHGGGCVGVNTAIPSTMGFYAAGPLFRYTTVCADSMDDTWASVNFASGQYPWSPGASRWYVGPAEYNETIQVTTYIPAKGLTLQSQFALPFSQIMVTDSANGSIDFPQTTIPTAGYPTATLAPIRFYPSTAPGANNPSPSAPPLAWSNGTSVAGGDSTIPMYITGVYTCVQFGGSCLWFSNLPAGYSCPSPYSAVTFYPNFFYYSVARAVGFSGGGVTFPQPGYFTGCTLNGAPTNMLATLQFTNASGPSP